MPTVSQSAPSKAEFHRVIAERSDRWYSACLRITRHPDLAQDAVQDALLNAWRKREQFERGSRLDTWIHRIAINSALMLVRKQKPGVFEVFEDEADDPSAAPDRQLYDAELQDRLSRQLERLSDVERVCFILKHLEQWRIREIASHIGAGEGAVKQALFRGVRKLRVSMQELKAESV